MKTKILVCSSSGIDYIPHSENITAIPVIIKFSNEEQYQDFIDINADTYFSRVSLDKNAKVSLVYQKYDKIKTYIDDAVNNGYKRILILLADKNFSNLEISIALGLANENRIECVIFNSMTTAYPLSLMAIEANEMITNGANITKVIKRLNSIKSKMLFFIPKEQNESIPKFDKEYLNGNIVELVDGKLVNVPKYKDSTAFESLFTNLLDDITKTEIIPFVLYSDKYSKYINLIGDILVEKDFRFKKAKYYPISPAIGAVIGNKVLCIGYVVK